MEGNAMFPCRMFQRFRGNCIQSILTHNRLLLILTSQRRKEACRNEEIHFIAVDYCGNKLFLVLMTGGSVYYTATLEMKKDNKELYGNYYYPKDKEQIQPYPMSLKRIN